MLKTTALIVKNIKLIPADLIKTIDPNRSKLFPASGKRPVHGEPPTAEDVLRSIARVLERPSTEASDVELLQWIGEDSWIARHFCRMSRDFLFVSKWGTPKF